MLRRERAGRAGWGAVMDVKLRIDWILCDGYSLCSPEAPDVIDLDEWGYPIIRSGVIAEHELKGVKRAVGACPMSALSLRPLDFDKRS